MASVPPVVILTFAVGFVTCRRDQIRFQGMEAGEDTVKSGVVGDDLAENYAISLKGLAEFTDEFTIKDERFVGSWEGGITNKRALPYKKSPKVFNSAPKRPQESMDAMASELLTNLKEDKPVMTGKMDLSLYDEIAVYKDPSLPASGVPANSFPDLSGAINTDESEAIVLDGPTIKEDKIIISVYVQMAMQIQPGALSHFRGVAEFAFQVKDGLVVEAVETYVDFASGPPGSRTSIGMDTLIPKAMATVERPDPQKSCLELTDNQASCDAEDTGEEESEEDAGAEPASAGPKCCKCKNGATYCALGSICYCKKHGGKKGAIEKPAIGRCAKSTGGKVVKGGHLACKKAF